MEHVTDNKQISVYTHTYIGKFSECMRHIHYFVEISVKKEIPKFIKKPENVECMEFDDVRFETTISGKPEPTVEWYRGDVKYEPSENVIYEKTGNVYALVLKKVRQEEAGMITVKALNELGDMAASARLKVTGNWNELLADITFTLSYTKL